MEQLQRAIRLIADQTVTGYYFDELSSKPLKITFKAAFMHPDSVMAGMNIYLGDAGKEGENHLKQQHKIEGIDVYEFTNKGGTKGALAITTDLSKAERAFGEIGLMEKSVEKETKQPKDKGQTKGKPTELQLVVTEASKEQADRITSNLELISQQAGMPLKVVMKAKGSEWEYTFQGTIDPTKVDRLKEKVNDYLAALAFEWVEEKAANTGDYSYEPTYL